MDRKAWSKDLSSLKKFCEVLPTHDQLNESNQKVQEQITAFKNESEEYKA